MADWDGLRDRLEESVTPPPLTALRERRRHRQQRRTLAMATAVVMVGTASGVALLGRAAERERLDDPIAAPPPALSQIVNGAQLPPPRDYEEHVVTDVDFVSATTGWAIGIRCVGDACDVASWRTDDGGRTWSAPVPVANGVPRASFQEEDPAGGAVRSLRMIDGQRGYAFNPDLYVTTDGGRTWRRDPRTSRVSSLSAIGDSVWVVERGCPRDDDCDLQVYGGVAGGQLREVDVPPTAGALALVRRSSERDGYLLTWDAPAEPRAVLHVTRDGGATWTQRTHPCPDATAVAMNAGAGRTAWLVCTTPAGRTAFRSDDAGTTWRAAGRPPADGDVTDLLGRSATEAYLATQTPGRLLHTTDGGATWRPAEGTGKAYSYVNLDAVETGEAWAMGDAGHLWRTTDGARWERLALPPGAPRPAPRPSPSAPDDRGVVFGSLHFLDANRGWALGQRCVNDRCRIVLRRTTDGGVTWQAMGAPPKPWRADMEPMPSNKATTVRFADDDNGWVFGQNVFATHDGGKTWRDVTWGYVYDVEPRGDVYWSVGYEGCLSNPCGPWVVRDRVGDDDPAPAEGFAARGHEHGAFTAFDEDTAYFVDNGHAVDDPDVPEPVVVGTTDGGKTWRSHPAPCRRAGHRTVSAYAPGGLWVLCGGLPDDTLWASTSADGGKTWRTLRLPERGCCVGPVVAFSETQAWRVVAGAATAPGVHVTRDGGRTWQRTLRAGVVALEAVDAEHGWVLDGDGYVHRTTDGFTWEQLGRP